MSIANPDTGEVVDSPGADVELVTLNLASLDEEELLRLPTPVQAAGALIRAREAARRAPAALDTYRRRLKVAERDLVIAIAKGARDLLDEYPRMLITERRDLARATDKRVLEAVEARDEAWCLMEYARDWDRALGRDIDILRSLNANLRQEHS